jgi:hypothetical protein
VKPTHGRRHSRQHNRQHNGRHTSPQQTSAYLADTYHKPPHIHPTHTIMNTALCHPRDGLAAVSSCVAPLSGAERNRLYRQRNQARVQAGDAARRAAVRSARVDLIPAPISCPAHAAYAGHTSVAAVDRQDTMVRSHTAAYTRRRMVPVACTNMSVDAYDDWHLLTGHIIRVFILRHSCRTTTITIGHSPIVHQP